jgi:hypothetical protein
MSAVVRKVQTEPVVRDSSEKVLDVKATFNYSPQLCKKRRGGTNHVCSDQNRWQAIQSR